jgi:hypothetical protein
MARNISGSLMTPLRFATDSFVGHFVHELWMRKRKLYWLFAKITNAIVALNWFGWHYSSFEISEYVRE